MIEANVDILPIKKDNEIIQSLDALSYTIKNESLPVPTILPFLDKKSYIDKNNDLDDSIKDEIEYNKSILSNGIFNIFLFEKEFKSGNKEFVKSMTSKDFIRGFLEAYVKLKNWNVDISDVLRLYNQNINGVEQKLTKEFLEQTFHQLIAAYVDQYNGSLLDVILKKYLYDLKQEKNSVNVEIKKPFFKGNQKWEKEQRIKTKKIESKKDNTLKDVQTVLQDMLTYYEFKNMTESGFVSIYTPVDCVEKDFNRIQTALTVYEQFVPQIEKDIVNFVEYSRNPDIFLEKYKNEKGVLSVEGKLLKLEFHNLEKDMMLFENKVINLLNYYKFSRMYQTRDNESFSSPVFEKRNKELEAILHSAMPLLPKRKDAYQKRLDY